MPGAAIMEDFILTPLDEDLSPHIYESDLLLIWKLYPRKVGRRKALTAIRHAIERLVAGESGTKMKKSKAIAELSKAVSLYSTSNDARRGPFTPHGTTWFNQSRYLDDPNEWFHQTEDERMRALNQVGVYHP
jgi:hypothetical protein